MKKKKTKIHRSIVFMTAKNRILLNMFSPPERMQQKSQQQRHSLLLAYNYKLKLSFLTSNHKIPLYCH